MKAVIIGGGVAGIVTALALREKGWQVVVREKRDYNKPSGMAYVIQSDNLSILEQFGDRKILSESNLLIKQFVLRNSQDQIIRSIELDDWHAIKRETIIEYLVGQLKQYELITNSHFSHFVKEGDDVKAAVFKDGSIEMGDLFIGADGIHSAVRGNICNAEFYPNEIDELVCLVDYRVKGDPYPTFTKYHEEKQGLAFGIVPVSETQSVWFNQYDKQKFSSLFEEARGNLRDFCSELLRNFPQEVRAAIKHSNFENSHLWKNGGLMLLDSYSKGNVCLIGDAAHAFISLTSAGITSAIKDAMAISDALEKNQSLSKAFKAYETNRKADIISILERSRELKSQFLLGNIRSQGGYNLPLVK